MAGSLNGLTIRAPNGANKCKSVNHQEYVQSCQVSKKYKKKSYLQSGSHHFQALAGCLNLRTILFPKAPQLYPMTLKFYTNQRYEANWIPDKRALGMFGLRGVLLGPGSKYPGQMII